MAGAWPKPNLTTPERRGAPLAQAITAAQQTSALQAVVDETLATLDALADLGLAEATLQLTGRNMQRAGAALDMLGRAGRPPDQFDDVVTPQPAKRIEQRLIACFSDPSRAAGWSSASPRSALAPLADAFLTRCLGPATEIVIAGDATDGTRHSLSLDALGIGALDLAADAAAAAASSEGRAGSLLLAALRRQPGVPGDVTVSLNDPSNDGLATILVRAGAWHRAFAGRSPLTEASVRPAGQGHSETAKVDADCRQRLADLVETVIGADESSWWLFGIGDAGEHAQRAQTANETRAHLSDPLHPQSALDVVRAALGSDAVLTATHLDVASAIADAAQRQSNIVAHPGADTAAWLQDSARISEAARALDEAVLGDELVGLPPALNLLAWQTPAKPYAAGTEPALEQRWVGGQLAGPLAQPPVTGFLFATTDSPDPTNPSNPPGSAAFECIELDRWVEAIPETVATAGIAAHLSAPNARAGNTILLAVPGDSTAPWSSGALFDTVDEAFELAKIRLVDLDATSRVAALLPAIYVEENNLDRFSMRRFVINADVFPGRFQWKVDA